MKSALFVDFDNVFSQLKQLHPDAAERFARQPSEWIGWLTSSLALPDPHDDGARRRLLVRRCYLNPNWYQSYRHAFLRAGFEIVDCPPVTSQGKTSTDIHMVLDIVDLLQHETRYDEFIVFSADADFTPVLRKLRRYDRRTTVLAIGFPSAAYQASADLMIDERSFVREALGLGPPVAEAAPVPDGLAPQAGDDRAAEARVPAPEAGVPAPEAGVPAPEAGVPAPEAGVPASEARVTASEARTAAPTPAAARPEPDIRPAPRAATPEEVTELAARLWTMVEESAQPASAALLASRLRQECPAILDNWNGLGSFKAFFRSLQLSRLLWMSGAGGRVLDPSRHAFDGELPEQDAESPWAGAESVFPVVREVCVLTGAPMLAPRDLKVVIDALVKVLQQQEFKLAVTVQAVCRRCVEVDGLRVRPRDVNFLVRGMQMNGHDFAQGPNDRATLLGRLYRQVLFLCEREQKVLGTIELGHIQSWIGAPAAAGP